MTELRTYGTVAHATMVLEHGPDEFTDLFLLGGRADHLWDQGRPGRSPRTRPRRWSPYRNHP
ncbi:MAG: hypothetical protein DLM58_08895 [Pseudonocardiales bacterium]|nr:MAG: hypothetical protein DLM58_08895 [Pseudonocardiales bacterium]